jgi:hypothetical protein
VAQTVAATVPVLLETVAQATAGLKGATSSTAAARELVALIADSAAAIKALREL